MWRALVLATGYSLCAFGAEFMIVDRLVMVNQEEAPAAYSSPYLDNDYLGASDVGSYGSSTGYGRRVFVPPEWAPWGFVSAGVLTVLYGLTLPGRPSE